LEAFYILRNCLSSQRDESPQFISVLEQQQCFQGILMLYVIVNE